MMSGTLPGLEVYMVEYPNYTSHIEFVLEYTATERAHNMRCRIGDPAWWFLDFEKQARNIRGIIDEPNNYMEPNSRQYCTPSSRPIRLAHNADSRKK